MLTRRMLKKVAAMMSTYGEPRSEAEGPERISSPRSHSSIHRDRSSSTAPRIIVRLVQDERGEWHYKVQ